MEKTKYTKLYYSITEVATILGLKPHILRYWESEFPMLKPKKNRAGNRAYRQKDIDIARTIKYLLYEDGYTIDGALKKLHQMRERGIDIRRYPDSQRGKVPTQAEMKKLLRDIRDGLIQIKKLLENHYRTDT